MNTQEHKNHILAFMPVMKELELMGYNPVEILFGREFKIELIEDCYIAIFRAKKKYPKWSAVIGKWISKKMQERKEE